MHILIINHYAGSQNHGMEYRPYFLAKEWIKAGHAVTVIGASFSHLRSVQPVCDSAVTIENIEGIKYIWLQTYGYHGNGLKRIINMLTFSSQVFMKEMPILKPDVVIDSSTYPLTIFGSHKIAKKHNAKLIFEVHDLWPLSPMELGGFSKMHPFIVIMQLAEDYAYKNADRVVSVLPNAREHMVKHGMAQEKFSYVPNGIDINDWKLSHSPPKEHADVLEKLKQENKFVFGYVGAHGLSNALRYFIEAAVLLKENNKIHFLLVGQGPMKKELQAIAEREKLKNINFLPAVPKNTVPDILSCIDVFYIAANHNPLYRFGVSPNKMFDYMMAGKPIVNAIQASNDLVAESGCGITIPPANPPAIAEAIQSLYKLIPQERDAMGRQGNEFVLLNHDYVRLADRFLKGL